MTILKGSGCKFYVFIDLLNDPCHIENDFVYHTLPGLMNDTVVKMISFVDILIWYNKIKEKYRIGELNGS